MKKISSEYTMPLKRIYPVTFLIGFIVLIIMFGSSIQEEPVFLLILVMYVMPVCVVLNSVWSLMDEVFDYGDYLEIRFKGEVDTVYLSDIMSVIDTSKMHAQSVTLSMRESCKFGRNIAFSPTLEYGLNAFKTKRVAVDLKSRVDDANKQSE